MENVRISRVPLPDTYCRLILKNQGCYYGNRLVGSHVPYQSLNGDIELNLSFLCEEVGGAYVPTKYLAMRQTEAPSFSFQMFLILTGLAFGSGFTALYLG